MEQFYKIKYSGVIATLLLYKREITAIDIINFCSKISDEYEVIDDGIQDLFECVEVDSQFNFRIKKYLDYYSILRDGKTVLEFLNSKALMDLIYIYVDMEKETEIVQSSRKDFEFKGKIFDIKGKICKKCRKIRPMIMKQA